MLLAMGAAAQAHPRFDISFPASAHAQPVTGRVYVMITRNEQREPRLQVNQVDGIPFFGRDVVQLAPGATAVIDDTDLGYPVDNLRDIPAGDYSELLKAPQIQNLIERQIDKFTADFAPFERVKGVVLLERELTAEEGELTPTLKIRRRT